MTRERWQQITVIARAARECGPAEREGFVAQACQGDRALRLEVDALLANDGEQFGETAVMPSESCPTSDPSVYPGASLGPYLITGRLGAGGMGEVFRAHDTRLGRDVAIKALPAMFVASADRLARFRDEARMLASLNHPNIAAIYGLERCGDADHLVLELVEGENLRGPLPVRTALEYGRQIATAIEAAHGRGIIHRDLKPSNIRVTPEGTVKVLDFGLAKPVSLRRAVAGASASLDAAGDVASEAGLVVGSVAYMSPEQARGSEVDERTDIWAFGCVLYELLTGRRAFSGDVTPRTPAPLVSTPDWAALPSATPVRVRECLRRCFERDPSRRIRSMTELRRTLEDAQRPWFPGRAALAVGAMTLAAVIGLIVWSTAVPPVPERVPWVPITRLPDAVSQPSLSPDGRQVTFIRGSDTFYGPGQVYLKTLPDGEPVALTNDSLKKMSPTFSPDGSRIAYTTVNSLFEWDTWIVPTSGGPAKQWLRNASGLVWTGPGQVLFSEMRATPHMGIVAADENGLHRRDVYFPPHGHDMVHRSYPAPDGKWLLVVEMDRDHAWAPCRIVPMDGRSAGRQVGPPHAGCTSGAWSPDGNWIFVISDSGGARHIWRQRVADGEPEQVTFGPTSEDGITVAPDGRSLIASVALQNGSIWLREPQGDRQISALEGTATNAKFTRDGKRLCYVIVKEYPSAYATQPGQVWVADLVTGSTAPVAPGIEAFDYDVSADGQQVIIEALDADRKFRLYLAPLDRRAQARQIANVEGRQPRFGPDGSIFFRASGSAYRVGADGAGLRKAIEEPVLLLNGISPDGRWLVAWSPVRGENAVAYQAFSFSGAAPIEISRDIIWTWSPDGRSVSLSDGPISAGLSYLIPLPPGAALPTLPTGGLRSEEDVARLPGARRIETLMVPGPSQDVYAFYRDTSQRNLYRISLP